MCAIILIGMPMSVAMVVELSRRLARARRQGGDLENLRERKGDGQTRQNCCFLDDRLNFEEAVPFANDSLNYDSILYMNSLSVAHRYLWMGIFLCCDITEVEM